MRKLERDNHTIDIVFMLALFCAFATAVLSVLLAGAGAYQSIAGNMPSSQAVHVLHRQHKL